MLDTKYTEYLNEAIGMISQRKLRDAMHDIIVELGPKETIDIEELANRLMSEHKITISPFFLDKFLDNFIKVKRGDRTVHTFFTKGDTRWLGVRDIKGTKEIRNNLLYQKPILAKHKKRLFAEEERKRLDDAYKAGMKDLSFSEDVIKKTFILQKPEDSAEFMKNIYSDIVINKLYDNTYDNCWKLMMLIGRQNKLDRIRGWFKLAPESVKEEYFKGEEGHRRINYDLTKPPKEAKKTKPVNPKRDLDLPPETEQNLNIVDGYLKKYKNWGEFINDTSLRNVVEMIDSLSVKTPSGGENVKFEEFLSKLDQLNLILTKYYRVDRRDVIMFYRNIGLAGYLREWETMKNRPKINDF